MNYTLLEEDIDTFQAVVNNFNTCVRNKNLLGSEYWLMCLTGVQFSFWTHMGPDPSEEKCRVTWQSHACMNEIRATCTVAYEKLRREIVYPSCNVDVFDSF